MAASEDDWRLIREERRPGPEQMALDEIAAGTAGGGGPATIRTYRWGPSCLTLGYGQDAGTVDWTASESAGADVTRRQTGGGGIHHDAFGDVAYSIAVPASAVPGELLDCYHLLCEPILDAFDRLGIDADYVDEAVPALYDPACYLRELHPAHDVVADGRKIAGNAQYRTRDAVVQHGSLTFSVDADAHLAAFADPPVTPKAFRERVVGIDELADVDRAEAVRTLEASLASWVESGAWSEGTPANSGVSPALGDSLDRNGSWTEVERDRARDLVTEKYRDDDWVRSGSKDRE